MGQSRYLARDFPRGACPQHCHLPHGHRPSQSPPVGVLLCRYRGHRQRISLNGLPHEWRTAPEAGGTVAGGDARPAVPATGLRS